MDCVFRVIARKLHLMYSFVTQTISCQILSWNSFPADLNFHKKVFGINLAIISGWSVLKQGCANSGCVWSSLKYFKSRENMEFMEYPKDPSVLKIVRRATSLRRERKKAQKRNGNSKTLYRECSEVPCFSRKKKKAGKRGIQSEKLRR